VKVKGGYKSGEVLWMACVQLLVFANGAELSRDYLGISSGHSALSPVMAEASFSPSLGQVPFPVHLFPSPFLPFPFLLLPSLKSSWDVWKVLFSNAFSVF